MTALETLHAVERLLQPAINVYTESAHEVSEEFLAYAVAGSIPSETLLKIVKVLVDG